MKMPRPYTLCLALAGILGLMAAGRPAAADSNIVINGGFETGDLAPWTTDFFFVGNTPGYAYEGTYYATFFADPFLSQTLTTTPGQSYTLSFAAATDDPQNSFDVLWNGSTVPGSPSSVPANGLAQADYTPYSFTVTATGTSTVLEFDVSAFDFELDGVSAVPVGVAATPEPGSVALLLGMSATGAGLLRKKRRR